MIRYFKTDVGTQLKKIATYSKDKYTAKGTIKTYFTVRKITKEKMFYYVRLGIVHLFLIFLQLIFDGVRGSPEAFCS